MISKIAEKATFSHRVEKQLRDLEPLIGNTPLYHLKYFSSPRVQIYGKMEWLQYGGSVKSKPAFQMLSDAVSSGVLTEETVVTDASSGNTGIALAHLCASMKIPLRIYIPEKATIERKTYLKALGAEIVYTDPDKGTDYSREVVKADVEANPNLFFLVDQYGNQSNWKAHYRMTGPEVLEQTQGRITHFCCGLGTSGTFVGTSRYLNEINPHIQRVALQPNGPDHGLEGWKHLATASVPKIFDPSTVDQHVFVDPTEVPKILKLTAEKCGLLLSPSSAANLLGAIQLAETIEEGKIVTVFPDDASKYNDIYKNLYF